MEARAWTHRGRLGCLVFLRDEEANIERMARIEARLVHLLPSVATAAASVSVPIVVPQVPPPAAPPVSVSVPIASDGFGPLPNTLTKPVWDTVKRVLARIVSNLKLIVFPNPYREDPGKALRDWDLWGPFFCIVFLGLTLSWSASVKKEPTLLLQPDPLFQQVV
ncbi:hypothetical protein E2562_014744 [Oryza meyeriana var. granulata]|uniref:Uncharacterized protein n=1 Tax=Oryza meyeriana var. granulata TaxID=110450 RepID=A0A6G1BKP1_9ORYZ|nr:hypothetical protein E2562_014744 [Oryza meyeriana var. granulata]